MFTLKNKSNSEESPATSASIIGAGTTITGNVESNGDIRVDGTIKGNIYSKAKVLVGPAGFVEGDMHCNEADISGQVSGRMVIQGLLVLKANAIVNGDIHTAKLFMEPSVSFNGQCHMGANIVELKQEIFIAVNE